MINKYLSNQKAKESINWKGLLWKSTKILIFVFFIVTSLWGCGQQIFDKNVMPFNSPGSGFEICINPARGINNHIISKGNEVYYSFISNFQQAIKLGPFYGLFVWPLSFLTSKLSISMGTKESIPTTMSIICTILIIVLLIRGIITIFSYKQFKQQLVMQKIQPKIAQIKSKYQGVKDLATRQKMQMELMELNKKYGVNPISAILSTFITLPFFYSMYRVFSSLRIFKEGYLFNFNYKMIYSPFNAIFSHHYYIYILIVIFLIPIQFISFKIPTWLSSISQSKTYMDEKAKKEFKRTKTITNVIAIVFALMAFELPISIGFYWFFSSSFTIAQTIFLWKHQQKKVGKSTKIINFASIKRNFKNKIINLSLKFPFSFFILLIKSNNQNSKEKIKNQSITSVKKHKNIKKNSNINKKIVNKEEKDQSFQKIAKSDLNKKTSKSKKPVNKKIINNNKIKKNKGKKNISNRKKKSKKNNNYNKNKKKNSVFLKK